MEIRLVASIFAVVCLIGLEICVSADGFQNVSGTSFNNISIVNVTRAGWNSTESEGTSDLPFPKEYWTEYPYYVSGYDYEGRPVLIAETGKWDYQKAINKGPDEVELLHKYFTHMFSLIDEWSLQTPLDECVLMLDYDTSSTGAAVLETKEATKIEYQVFANLYKKRQKIGYGIIVNAGYKTQLLLNLVRPILGDFNEKIEIHGTNPAKWIPHILRKIPREQIPANYGGVKDFRAVWIPGKDHN